MDLKEISLAIERILQHKEYVHPYFSNIILQKYLEIIERKNTRPNGILTNREWEVLDDMVRGLQNDDIAKHLSISSKTVKNHVSSILKKLQVKDRTNAVVTAIRNHWVSI